MNRPRKSFWSVFNSMIRDKGLIAYREGWPDDRYITIKAMPGGKMMIAVHDKNGFMPYSIQQEDLFIRDWEVE